MKKQNLNTRVRRSILKISLATALLIGLTSAASAQESAQQKNPAISYIGTLDGQPVFNVALENKDNSVYYLSIKDEQGYTLYSEKIKDKQFSKKFKFDGSELGSLKLTFTLESDKGVESQVFNVNTNTRFLKDVVVTKL